MFRAGTRGGAAVGALRYKPEGCKISIPDGVIGIFYSNNTSGRTKSMTLGSTQPLIDMSTRNSPFV
jgi:hypothetical protein